MHRVSNINIESFVKLRPFLSSGLFVRIKEGKRTRSRFITVIKLTEIVKKKYNIQNIILSPKIVCL